MLRVSTVVLILACAAGCRPTYPACKNDDDCNRDKQRGEFCVNQKCQQCRNIADCPAGKECKQGRCDPIPDYCESDAQCAGGRVCREHRCQPCGGDAECGESGRCRQGKCLRKGSCESDDDCPQAEDCKDGVCIAAMAPKASQNAACHLVPVHFDFNESSLTGDATEKIDQNASCIRQVGRAARLIGRADERGTVEYNLALSERRAQAVRDRLIRLGIDGDKLQTLPKGELEVTGKDEQGWAKDRRVDFEWM